MNCCTWTLQEPLCTALEKMHATIASRIGVWNTDGKDHFNSLSHEIVVIICAHYLEARDVIALRAVSRRLCTIIDSEPDVWRSQLLRSEDWVYASWSPAAYALRPTNLLQDGADLLLEMPSFTDDDEQDFQCFLRDVEMDDKEEERVAKWCVEQLHARPCPCGNVVDSYGTCTEHRFTWIDVLFKLRSNNALFERLLSLLYDISTNDDEHRAQHFHAPVMWGMHHVPLEPSVQAVKFWCRDQARPLCPIGLIARSVLHPACDNGAVWSDLIAPTMANGLWTQWRYIASCMNIESSDSGEGEGEKVVITIASNESIPQSIVTVLSSWFNAPAQHIEPLSPLQYMLCQ